MGRFRVAALVLIAIYFLALAGDGLRAYFMPDDGLNLHTLHGYWETPARDILKAALTVITPGYRPLGGLFYRSIFAVAGFDPFPFRVTCFLLLLLNLVIVYRLSERLTGSVQAALLATFLFSYHPGLADLYYNTATVYDILCFLFYSLALLYYVSFRQAGARCGWRHLPLLLLLYGCALDSKEMAATLPAAILAFEILYFRRQPMRTGSVGHFCGQQGLGFLATAALTAPFLAVKLLTQNPLTASPIYHPRVSLGSIFDAMAHYHEILFCPVSNLNASKLVLFWLLLLALALLLKSRTMLFSLCLAVITMLPVCVIDPPRAGFILYLPMLGWAMYFGVLLGEVGQAVARTLHVAPAGILAQTLAMVLTVVVIATLHTRIRPKFVSPIKNLQENARGIMQQATERHPSLPPGARIAFLDDPLPANDWSALFFFRLKYGDPTIWVDRTKLLNRRITDPELPFYDYVFTYRNGELRQEPVSVSTTICPPREPIQLAFQPDRVKPGNRYTVAVNDHAGETIDLAYTLSIGRATYSDVARKWCTLDASGRAELTTPVNHPDSIVRIQKIRSQTGCWVPAQGVIQVRR